MVCLICFHLSFRNIQNPVLIRSFFILKTLLSHLGSKIVHFLQLDINEERANEDSSSSEATPCSDLPTTSYQYPAENTQYLPLPSSDTPPYSNLMPSPPYYIKSKRSKIAATPIHIEETMNTLKSLKEKVEINKEMEDEFGYFGRNVACQLRQLPIMDALDCQSEILLLLQQKRKLNCSRENNSQAIDSPVPTTCTNSSNTQVSENLVQCAVSSGPSGTNLSSYIQEQTENPK